MRGKIASCRGAVGSYSRRNAPYLLMLANNRKTAKTLQKQILNYDAEKTYKIYIYINIHNFVSIFCFTFDNKIELIIFKNI